MTRPWHLVVLWGVVVGAATGSLASVVGPIVANRWFVRHRGLVTGIFAAGSATGQLVFLPTIARLATSQGWRSASLVVAGLALLLVPLVLLAVRDRPADSGCCPWGPTDPDDPRGSPGPRRRAPGRGPHGARRARAGGRGPRVLGARRHLLRLRLVDERPRSARTSSPPRTTTGCRATTAAGLLALVGGFDLVGTIASGWLSDRVDPRFLLLAYYGLRGLALLGRARGPGAAGRPAAAALRRLLRPRLDRDRAADGGAVPRGVRARALRCRLRLGVRRATWSGRRWPRSSRARSVR